MVAGALTVFTVVLAIDVLHLGNAGVGYLDCAFGVGGVVGGVAAVGLAGARRLAAAFAAGVLAWGVGRRLLGVTTSTVVALVLLAGVGIGNTVVDVAAVTLLQRSAADAVLGRVFGVLETLLLSARSDSARSSHRSLIHVLGVRAALVSTGLVLPVVVVAFRRALVALDRPGSRDRRADGRSCAPTRSSPARRGHARAACAQRLERSRSVAGTRGDPSGRPGDRVYLVARANWLWMSTDGRPSTSARARSFGEIALLRDVPRTATVRARRDRRDCSTLGRDEFLAAVTGHPTSAAEADVVVATRLAAFRPGVVKA